MKVRGIKFNLHETGDLFSNAIRRDKDFYEADILDYLRDYHYTQETILDIGANIGNHTLYFANFLQYSNIYAFEPVPDNFKILASNIESYKNIEIYQYAISDRRGWLNMVQQNSNMGASAVNEEGALTVRSSSLDRLNFSNVTLMKIDVENHEPFVLEGAKDTIFRCHPLILIEDSRQVYDKLLPDYELERAWPEHQTYLYKWRENAGVYRGGL